MQHTVGRLFGSVRGSEESDNTPLFYTGVHEGRLNKRQTQTLRQESICIFKNGMVFESRIGV